MTKDISKLVEKRNAGEAVADLANLIGWSEVLLPRLQKELTNLTKQLTRATLGEPVTTASGDHLSPIQIAGRIYGLDYAVAEFERIIREGIAASSTLNSITTPNMQH